MSKRTVRLTESDLHNIIKESVKKVLNETEKQISELESLAQFLNINPSDINGSYHLYYVHTPNNQEQTWYVWSSYKEAENHVLENADDYLEGMTSDNYWYNAGFEKNENGEFNWYEIAEEILNTDGVEWFFSNYDGSSHELPNGYVGFRVD